MVKGLEYGPVYCVDEGPLEAFIPTDSWINLVCGNSLVWQ